MDTEYNAWNEIKKNTQRGNRTLTIKPRDIFWAKIGHNLGHEEFGKGDNFSRPVIIIKSLTRDLFIGIPLTSTVKPDSDYFHGFRYRNYSRGEVDSTAMVLQLKTFSKKRLMNKTGVINIGDFDKILEKSRNLLI